MRRYQSAYMMVVIAAIQCTVVKILSVSHATGVFVKIIVGIIPAHHARHIPAGQPHTVIVLQRKSAAIGISHLFDPKSPISNAAHIATDAVVARTADANWPSSLVAIAADLRARWIGDTRQFSTQIIAIGKLVRTKSSERSRLAC